MGKDGIWDDAGGNDGKAAAAPAGWLARGLALLDKPMGPSSVRGDALAWLAVAFATGIGLWFFLPRPPQRLLSLAFAALAALSARAGWRRAGQPALMLMAACLAGLSLMGLKGQAVSTRLLRANAGQVELAGQVERIWRAAPARMRLILRITKISRLRRAHWPQRVRLTLAAGKGRGLHDMPLPGDRIAIAARLSRLPQPVEPGAYDPARSMWFSGIGATAFAYTTKLRITDRACAHCGILMRAERRLEALRRAIAARVRLHMGGTPAAALAVTLLTGGRGYLDRQEQETLRLAGLAHILAISGLHLSLVAGAVFWLLRAVLALVPSVALRWPVKKLSAVLALLAAFAYLLLSGNSIATQRAFIMLMVMTLALILDRPAITMRNLAIAALVILAWAPQTLVQAGFQMSFLAVMGLVSAYEALSWQGRRRKENGSHGQGGAARRLVWPVMAFIAALVFSTLIASAMTALPAVIHFNQLAAYGVLGNLLALPLLTAVVMPAGLAALLLMPVGLEEYPLWLMRQGLDGILWWSARIAALPHARIAIAQPSLAAAALILAGLVWLTLRRDGRRLAGLILIAAGMALPAASRPDILISPAARVMAVRNAAGLLVPVPGKRGAYVIGRWLRHDGDGTPLDRVRARKGWRCEERICQFVSPAGKVVWIAAPPWRKGQKGKTGKRAAAELQDAAAMDAACSGARVVAAAIPLRRRCARVAVRIDRFDVWKWGAHAVFLHGARGRPVIATARSAARPRPWSPPPLARRKVLLPVARNKNAGSAKRRTGVSTLHPAGPKARQVRNSQSRK